MATVLWGMRVLAGCALLLGGGASVVQAAEQGQDMSVYERSEQRLAQAYAALYAAAPVMLKPDIKTAQERWVANKNIRCGGNVRIDAEATGAANWRHASMSEKSRCMLQMNAVRGYALEKHRQMLEDLLDNELVAVDDRDKTAADANAKTDAAVDTNANVAAAHAAVSFQAYCLCGMRVPYIDTVIDTRAADSQSAELIFYDACADRASGMRYRILAMRLSEGALEMKVDSHPERGVEQSYGSSSDAEPDFEMAGQGTALEIGHESGQWLRFVPWEMPAHIMSGVSADEDRLSVMTSTRPSMVYEVRGLHEFAAEQNLEAWERAEIASLSAVTPNGDEWGYDWVDIEAVCADFEG